jgi:hypothetical protein
MNKTANRLTDMEFDEVSLVNRPANQLSKVLLFKSDTVTEDEMSNLEVEEVVSEEVTSEEVSAEESVEKGYGKMSMKKGKKKMPMMEMEDEDEDMEGEESPMKKRNQKRSSMRKEDESGEIEIPAEVFEYIESLESANAELMDSIEKMQNEKDAELAQQEEEIFKSADPRLVQLIKSAEDRAVAAETIAKAERDFRLEREFVSKAQELGSLPLNADSFGIILKSAADVLTTEQYDAIWQVLSAANAQISAGGIFGEVGKSTVSGNDTSMSAIEQAAARLRQEDSSLSKEQAIAKAVSADASLYNQYIREGR